MGILSNAAWDGGKKIFDEPIVSKAVSETAGRHPDLESLEYQLRQWSEDDQYSNILKQLQAGKRNISNENIVASFIETTHFFTGDNTKTKAQTVVSDFLQCLTDQFLLSKFGRLYQSRRDEVLHSLLQEDIKEIKRLLEQILEKFDDGKAKNYLGFNSSLKPKEPYCQVTIGTNMKLAHKFFELQTISNEIWFNIQNDIEPAFSLTFLDHKLIKAELEELETKNTLTNYERVRRIELLQEVQPILNIEKAIFDAISIMVKRNSLTNYFGTTKNTIAERIQGFFTNYSTWRWGGGSQFGNSLKLDVFRYDYATSFGIFFDEQAKEKLINHLGITIYAELQLPEHIHFLPRNVIDEQVIPGIAFESIIREKAPDDPIGKDEFIDPKKWRFGLG